MQKEIRTVALSNHGIDVHIFRISEEKRPAIVFLPDLFGVGQTLLETAELLSLEGFQVFVPDIFSAEGIPRYCLRMFFDMAFVKNLADNPGVREVFEIIDWVKKQPYTDPERLGVVGQCLTGGYALHAALRPDVRAPVVFHHSFGITGSGMPEENARAICKKVQGHFVHIDPLCPKSRVEKLKEELGQYLEVNYYDWLPHGIPHFFRRSEEGRRAYINMLRFLKMQLA
ncbi:MAG: dienelactone hydrolase family protein [Turneriella sp.]|nr:dienelactone hydrolase family protein [Turneriella sp.]